MEAAKCEECGKTTELIISEEGKHLGRIEHHEHCPSFKPLD